MSNRKKKKVIKLQNKTNKGLFELDNIKRNYKKIQSVHRISPVDEATIYKKIGYKPRSSGKQIPKTDEEIEVLRPVTAEDLEDNIQPIINTNTVAAVKSFDSSSHNKKRDSLSNSGIG